MDAIRTALQERRTTDVGLPNPGGVTDPATWEARPDGSQKGAGFLGVLRRPDGGVMSEYSMSTDDLQKHDFPSLVPTLSQDEVAQILRLQEGQPMPPAIMHKALRFAMERQQAGKPLFAQDGEQDYGEYPTMPRATVKGTR